MWILTFFSNPDDIKKIANPKLFKNEIQQLQKVAAENILVSFISHLVSNFNSLLLFFQTTLLEMFNGLANVELKELEKLNTQLSTIPFADMHNQIQAERANADATTLPLLENLEKTIQLLEKIAFEAKQLVIEKQPDYEEVMLEILERDMASGGTLVRGKKALSKLFAED